MDTQIALKDTTSSFKLMLLDYFKNGGSLKELIFKLSVFTQGRVNLHRAGAGFTEILIVETFIISDDFLGNLYYKYNTNKIIEIIMTKVKGVNLYLEDDILLSIMYSNAFNIPQIFALLLYEEYKERIKTNVSV